MKNIAAFIFSFLLLGTVAEAQLGSSRFSLFPVEESHWTASLRTEVSNNLEVSRSVGGASTDTQLRMAYKFTDRLSVGFLIGAKYKVANQKELQSQQEVVASDAAIVANYTADPLWGSDKTLIDGRLYLPTSTDSYDKKQNFLLRADLILPYSFTGGRSLSVGLSPRLSHISQLMTKLDLQSQVRLTFGKSTAPYLALNHKIRGLNSLTGFSRAEEVMGPEAGIEIMPHSLVKLALSVSQDRPIFDPAKNQAHPEYSLFHPSETKYFLSAQVKL